MAQNIEIKARATNVASQLKLAEQISDKALETLVQRDTFFKVADGRLKLREFHDDSRDTVSDTRAAELIFYRRIDTSGPKLSEYYITETDDAMGLKSVLQKAYGIRQVVNKVRSLYMVGRTRLHFDAVENLGDFIELEVVLGEHDSVQGGEALSETRAQARAEAEALMQQLNIQASDLIDVAYVDLLEKQAA
ncbi:MAG: adenylate cyclase class IV [Chitinophagales bacterium]|jgi:adenylate cyclase class IV